MFLVENFNFLYSFFLKKEEKYAVGYGLDTKQQRKRKRLW